MGVLRRFLPARLRQTGKKQHMIQGPEKHVKQMASVTFF